MFNTVKKGYNVRYMFVHFFEYNYFIIVLFNNPIQCLHMKKSQHILLKYIMNIKKKLNLMYIHVIKLVF